MGAGVEMTFGDDFLAETGFSGSLKVEIPLLVSRLRLSKEAQMVSSLPNSEMDVAIKLAEIGQGHLKEVDLVHIDSGTEIKTVEGLLVSSEGAAVIYKVGSVIIQGHLLGKKKGS